MIQMFCFDSYVGEHPWGSGPTRGRSGEAGAEAPAGWGMPPPKRAGIKAPQAPAQAGEARAEVSIGFFTIVKNPQGV